MHKKQGECFTAITCDAASGSFAKVGLTKKMPNLCKVDNRYHQAASRSKILIMSISEFISRQLSERQKLLTQIHEIIIKEDKSVKAEIEPMMGKEMIVYKAPGVFKYGLSSMKNYMSLHVMPIYGSVTLYAKYKQLLNHANFQKGCINFKNLDEMPLEIVRELIAGCSKIDLRAIKDNYIKAKSKKS